MKRLMALFALIIATATSAHAGNWTGCYVGVGGDYTTHSSAFDLNNSGTPVASLDGIGNSGIGITPTLGCDLQMSRLVVGLFGDYTFNGDNSADLMFLGTSIGLVELGDSWTLGARAGILVSDSTLLYGLVGYTETDMGGLAQAIASSLNGYSLGGGIETELGAGFLGRLEYRHTFYDEESLALSPTWSLDQDVDADTVRASIIYKANFFN